MQVMLLGSATREATERLAARFGEKRRNGFYEKTQGLHLSTLGIGSYLGDLTDEVSLNYTQAVVAAVSAGINVIDTSLNYRHQRSERAIGQAIYTIANQRIADRDEYLVCTKAGFLVPGALPAGLDENDVVGGMHSMKPLFLRDQLERSRINLGIETVDVFYLHNPETQLAFVPRSEFELRVRTAFQTLEQLVTERKIQYYGVATWEGFRKSAGHQEGLSLPALVEIAHEVGGADHHFRFVQLPFNFAMTEAFTTPNNMVVGKQVSVLAAAEHYGVTVVASATLLQTRLLRSLPDAVRSHFPGAGSNAQACVQFTRSTPGITTALVGMSREAHVSENAAVSGFAPLSAQDYAELYSKAS